MNDATFDLNGALQRLRNGDKDALAELFSRNRDRLWNIVNVRLDRRLNGRVDADDILQEVYLDAADRIQHFINEHSGSFFVWLRLITTQVLSNVHRRHLDAKMRDAKREFSIFSGYHQPASTSLALQLLGDLTSPSCAAMRDELAEKLERAIDSMEEIDREVLKLRHFELLTNKEVAEVLQIQTKAASIRYVRALTRLKPIIETITGLSDHSTN